MKDWRKLARCAPLSENPDASGLEPELWFPVGTEGPAVRQAREAQDVCATCPVALECLEYALESGAARGGGVWGGVWFDVATPYGLHVARQYVDHARDVLSEAGGVR